MSTDNPKSRQDLEQQITDNMDVSTGQKAGAVAKGTLNGVLGGAAVGGVVAGHKYMDALAKSSKFAEIDEVALSGAARLTDNFALAQNLETAGFKSFKGQGLKGAWESVKYFAKTNPKTTAAVAGVTAALAATYTWLSMKDAREKNDQKIGEAYRTHKVQFNEEPFQEPSASKEPVGKYTSQVQAERANVSEHVRGA